MIETFLHLHRATIEAAIREGNRRAERSATLRSTLRGGTPRMAREGGQYTATGYQTWWKAGDVVGSSPVGP